MAFQLPPDEDQTTNIDEFDLHNLGVSCFGLHDYEPQQLTFQTTDVEPGNFYIGRDQSWTIPKIERTSLDILTSVDKVAKRHCKTIIDSSIDPSKTHRDLHPNSSGFVDAAFRAYANHYHLNIRPDDVWISILTQFSLYVNGHSEQFRERFVDFEGKEKIKITTEGFEFFDMAQDFATALKNRIKEPELHDWILPDFSTTSANDMVVSSVIMMATLKQYFDYEGYLICGIPSVTLRGLKGDWERLLQRIEKLKEFGLETTMWYHLLEPVLSRFVKAWDDPDGEWNKQFWARITNTHEMQACMGPEYITGWLTAFTPFDENGNWQLHPTFSKPRIWNDDDDDYDDDDDDESEKPSNTESEATPEPKDIEEPPVVDKHAGYQNLTRPELMIKYNDDAQDHVWRTQHPGPLPYIRYSTVYKKFGIEEIKVRYINSGSSAPTRLILDDTWYPRVEVKKVTPAVVTAPVDLYSNGKKINTMFAAGVVGYDVVQVWKSDTEERWNAKHTQWPQQILRKRTQQACSADETTSGYESTLKPRVGWWLYEMKTDEDSKNA